MIEIEHSEGRRGRIARFGRTVISGVLWILAAIGVATLEKYAPVLTPYVKTSAQKQQMSKAYTTYNKITYKFLRWAVTIFCGGDVTFTFQHGSSLGCHFHRNNKNIHNYLTL